MLRQIIFVKTLGLVSIVGGIIALSVYLYGKNKPDASPPIAPQKLMRPHQHTESQQNEQVAREYANGDAFYQVIIDNNIFRPLGWHPQTPKPKNILIGTVIATNTTQHTKAFIVDRQSGQLHSVRVNDRIGEQTIKEITAKQVILQGDGQELRLQIEHAPFF